MFEVCCKHLSLDCRVFLGDGVRTHGITVVFNKSLSFVLHQGARIEEHWVKKGHHLIMIICSSWTWIVPGYLYTWPYWNNIPVYILFISVWLNVLEQFSWLPSILLATGKWFHPLNCMDVAFSLSCHGYYLCFIVVWRQYLWNNWGHSFAQFCSHRTSHLIKFRVGVTNRLPAMCLFIPAFYKHAAAMFS